MYCVIRNYQDERPRVILKLDLTLEEAQDHCKDPETHGINWFDSWTDQHASHVREYDEWEAEHG